MTVDMDALARDLCVQVNVWDSLAAIDDEDDLVSQLLPVIQRHIDTTREAASPPLPGQRPSREHLIDLCERAVVPEALWRNRDTSSAQRQLGDCLALLRAGCDFHIRTDMGRDDGRTYWVRINFPGFDAFEEGSGLDDETFYVPTAQRLTEVAGGDWYC